MAPDNRERSRWRGWEQKRRPRRGGGQDGAARRAGAVRRRQRTRGQQRGGRRPSGGAALLLCPCPPERGRTGAESTAGRASRRAPGFKARRGGSARLQARRRGRGRGRGVKSLGGCARGQPRQGVQGCARRGSWARGTAGPPVRARAGALWGGERRPRRRQVAGVGDEEAAPAAGVEEGQCRGSSAGRMAGARSGVPPAQGRVERERRGGRLGLAAALKREMGAGKKLSWLWYHVGM